MKIACISTSSIPSLAANSIQVMKVCQALAQLGHEVCLILPGNQQTDWKELCHHYGLTDSFCIHRIPSLKSFKRFDFYLKALSMAKQMQSEVIYTRLSWVAGFAQMNRIPVMLELHDLPAGKFGKPLFLRFLSSRSKKLLILITAALGRALEQRFRIKIDETVRVIAPDGVDLSRYQGLPEAAVARQRLGLAETLTAVYTGGFYAGRGLELLVELARDNPKVQFLWVGGRPDAIKKWTEILQQQKITNIRLTGFVPNEELPLYQAAADILLMPFGRVVSGSSGGNTADVCSPLKMFEYMAAGRAILSSDLPVLREVLNETNAMFYALEEYVDLKEKFTCLVKDADLRARLARQARSDAAQYAWKERMQRILKVFEGL